MMAAENTFFVPACITFSVQTVTYPEVSKMKLYHVGTYWTTQSILQSLNKSFCPAFPGSKSCSSAFVFIFLTILCFQMVCQRHLEFDKCVCLRN